MAHVENFIKCKLTLIHQLERLTFLPLLGMRLWIANVFFNAGLVKLDDFEGTIALFADEYKVPILPPELAAYMGTAVELSAPLMLVFGLGARLGALALLAMTAVIEFTYMSFPEHQIWALMLLLILVYGPGKASIDQLIRSRLQRKFGI